MVDPNKISLVSVKLLKGSIQSDVDIILNKPKSKWHNFVFNLIVNTNREIKLIRLIIEVNINHADEERRPTNPAASFTTEFIYHIDNMEEVVRFDEETKGATLNGELAVTLTSISYSTLRGVVLMRTQGTVLDGVILPIIDPKKLVASINKEQEVMV